MTIVLPRMLALVLIGTASLGAFTAPIQAEARGGIDAASLAAPLPQPRQEIIGGALWKCAGDRCSAPASGSRPTLACERVVKAFGPVARFATPTGELSADELTRCNGGK